MIEIRNLTKIFKSKKHSRCIALDNISFKLPDKGFTFIVGKSGSGKTTLLSLIGGLDNITSGEIIINGNNLEKFNASEYASYRNSNIGFIFQDYHLIDDLTVKDNIKLALDLKGIENDNLILEALKNVDLAGYENRFPKELSGGQKQRVAIARAIVKNPSIILADEPTGNLDSFTTKSILELLKKLSKDKLVLIVSHDENDAKIYADRIIELADGKIINDLVRNKNFDERILLSNGTLFVPGNKRISKIEQDAINEKLPKVRKIVWNCNDFIPNTVNIEQKSMENKKENPHIKFSKKLKLGFVFLKKKWLSLFTYSLIISALMTVLGLCQLVVNFNENDVIDRELSKLNLSTATYLKYDLKDNKIEADKDFILPIENDDIDTFKRDGYKGNIYQLLDYQIPFNGSNSSFWNKKYNMLGNNVYPPETKGHLIVNKEFLIDKYGVDNKLQFKAKLDEEKPYGVYITDLCADYLMLLNKKKFPTYEAVLGEYHMSSLAYKFAYINGIIDTNYKSRYNDLIEEITTLSIQNENIDHILESSEYQEFLDEILNYLSISYSFNENFLEEIGKSCYFDGFTLGNDVVKGNNDYVINEFTIGINKKVKKGEMFIPLDLVKEIQGPDYYDPYEGFKPFEIDIDFYRPYDKNRVDKFFTKHFKVSGCDQGRPAMNPADISEIMAKEILPFELYFDDTSSIKTLNFTAEKLGYLPESAFIMALGTMTEAVGVFSNFFNLIFITICVGTLILIITYCLKVIKDRVYEIGVLKALGCRTKDLISVFLVQILTITLTILLMYNVFSVAFIGLANDILVESLKVLAKHRFIMNLTFIISNPLYMLFNSLLIAGLILVSVILSIIKLRNIKPINIIKAKE